MSMAYRKRSSRSRGGRRGLALVEENAGGILLGEAFFVKKVIEPRTLHFSLCSSLFFLYRPQANGLWRPRRAVQVGHKRNYKSRSTRSYQGSRTSYQGSRKKDSQEFSQVRNQVRPRKRRRIWNQASNK